MNPSPRPAVFIHDTVRIIEANQAALDLFRCEQWQMQDRELLEFVPAIYRDLTRMDLCTTRMGGGTIRKTRRYDFIRCDGSALSCYPRGSE